MAVTLGCERAPFDTSLGVLVQPTCVFSVLRLERLSSVMKRQGSIRWQPVNVSPLWFLYGPQGFEDRIGGFFVHLPAFISVVFMCSLLSVWFGPLDVLAGLTVGLTLR